MSKLLLQYNYYINYLPEGTILMGHMVLQLFAWRDFPDYAITRVVNKQTTKYLIELVKYIIGIKVLNKNIAQ